MTLPSFRVRSQDEEIAGPTKVSAYERHRSGALPALFRMYPRRPPWSRLGHTRAGPAGRTLVPMIRVDQLIIAAVACLTAARLIGAV